MGAVIFLILWAVCAVVCFVVKHSFFTVYYFEGGFIRQLAQIAAISLILALLIFKFVIRHFFICIVLILLVAGVVHAVRDR